VEGGGKEEGTGEEGGGLIDEEFDMGGKYLYSKNEVLIRERHEVCLYVCVRVYVSGCGCGCDDFVVGGKDLYS